MTEFARTAAVSESITLAVADRVRALEKAGRLIVKLQTGDPDFATPAAVVEAAGHATVPPLVLVLGLVLVLVLGFAFFFFSRQPLTSTTASINAVMRTVIAGILPHTAAVHGTARRRPRRTTWYSRASRADAKSRAHPTRSPWHGLCTRRRA